MMVSTPRTHSIHLLLAVLDDRLVAAVIQEVQIVISDEAGQRHDGIIFSVETGHLAVDPDQRVCRA